MQAWWEPENLKQKDLKTDTDLCNNGQICLVLSREWGNGSL